MFKIDGKKEKEKKIDILSHRKRTVMLTSDANVNETGAVSLSLNLKSK